MTVTIKSTDTDEEIKEALKRIKRVKKINVYDHLGVIKLVEDPLTIQKRMRDEW